MAWGPLAQGKNGVFGNETLKAIGAKYGKNNAQVCLRFLVDEGIIPIPKSTHKERMASNLDISDFSLTEEERETIRRMDTGQPFTADFNDPGLAKFLLNYDKNFNPDGK